MIIRVPKRLEIKSFTNVKALYPDTTNNAMTSSQLAAYQTSGDNLMDYLNPDPNKEIMGSLEIDDINSSAGNGKNYCTYVFKPGAKYTSTTMKEEYRDDVTYYLYVLGDNYLAFNSDDTLTAEQQIFVNEAKLLYSVIMDIHAICGYNSGGGATNIMFASDTRDIRLTSFIATKTTSTSSVNVGSYFYADLTVDGVSHGSTTPLPGSICLYMDGYGWLNCQVQEPVQFCVVTTADIVEEKSDPNEYVKV